MAESCQRRPAGTSSRFISNTRGQPCRLRLLLQAKLFSGRQQCDRFANAPFARFQSFSCVNPNDEVTSVGGRQLAKNSHALEFAFSALAMQSRRVTKLRA